MGSSELKLKQNEIIMMLLKKIIYLETQMIILKETNEALFLHLKPNGQENLMALHQQLDKLRPVLLKDSLERMNADLKYHSVDLDNVLQELLSQ